MLSILIWLSFALALQALDRFALREDEAIYSVWALHGWRIDPFFLTVWPDKPPLFLGLLAFALHFWGASQASGRLLNILLTLLTALVVGATARRLWGVQRGFVATALYLFNPFVLSFASTVYTDPLLVLAGQVALWLAIAGHYWGAGFWLGVAIMTKQQGLFYVPLIMAVVWTQAGGAKEGQPIWHKRRWVHVGLGALLVLAPVFYWDSSRWAVAPSPWALGARNYGALHLLPPSQWVARLTEWAALLWYFAASWPVWLALATLLILTFYRKGRTVLGSMAKQPIVVWLLLWGIGFLGLHMVMSIQPWDRYLLPLAPLFCLWVAWLVEPLITLMGGQRALRWSITSGLISLLMLTPPALTAARGGLPIGGDHGDYNGLTGAIAWLKQSAPPASILYHQRLGWLYQFYFFDELAGGRIDLRWFPTPAYLAANAAQSPTQPLFLVLPDWAPQPGLSFQLAVRQIELTPLAHFERMTLYALQNRPQPSGKQGCTWCLCKLQPSWPSRLMKRELIQP